MDPKNPTVQRIRWSFTFEGKVIRVCAPRVATRCEDDGRVRNISVGPLAQLRDIIDEWALRQFLTKHGTVNEADLEHLWTWHTRVAGRRQRIVRDPNGRWLLMEPFRERFGAWAQRVLRSDVARKYGHVSDWMNLLRAASPLTIFGPKAARQKAQATLYVPVDLRLPIERQLEYHRGTLSKVQRQVLERLGRKGPFRLNDDDLEYRNLYCYMLSSKEKWSAREIGEAVFPEERPATAAQKVRVILSNFRRRVKDSSPGPEV